MSKLPRPDKSIETQLWKGPEGLGVASPPICTALGGPERVSNQAGVTQHAGAERPPNTPGGPGVTNYLEGPGSADQTL